VLDSNPAAGRRLVLPSPFPHVFFVTFDQVFGRGYGASVADEMQTILNCNSLRLRQALTCSWWTQAGATCGSSYYIPRAGFQLDAFVLDGAHDFEKSDAKQLFQGVNLVGHIALQGKRSCSSRCPAQPLIPFVS
jgi:hypothetical protein